MSIEITYCEQNSPAWYEARLGVVTASEFKTVLAKGRQGEKSKTRDAYMKRLADENIYHKVSDYLYTNGNMDRGHVLQPEAESIYALTHDSELLRVGFVFNNSIGAGCSPDALVGDEKGVLEIKTAFPHILIGYHDVGVFPFEHKPQCQGILWVCQREYIDLMVYWPERDPFVARAYRDEDYIAKTLAPEVDRFNNELADMIVRLQQRRRAA